MEPHPASTRRIYLDHAATTPVRAEVEEALRPFLSEGFGNPSSLYAEGVRAREALEEARERIRGALGARDFEVVFTGSGTESDNAALRGIALQPGFLPPCRGGGQAAGDQHRSDGRAPCFCSG